MDDFVVHQPKGRQVPLTALIAQSVVSTHQPPVHSHQSSATRPWPGTVARDNLPICAVALRRTCGWFDPCSSTLAASSATMRALTGAPASASPANFLPRDEIERTRTAILGRAAVRHRGGASGPSDAPLPRRRHQAGTGASNAAAAQWQGSRVLVPPGPPRPDKRGRLGVQGSLVT